MFEIIGNVIAVIGILWIFFFAALHYTNISPFNLASFFEKYTTVFFLGFLLMFVLDLAD